MKNVNSQPNCRTDFRPNHQASNVEGLLQTLKNLVGDERKILAQILEALREVEHRRIFLKMGYPSLYDFCVKELGYPEASAYRRISAMRLIKEIPQIEKKIVDGTLSLSAVAQAQTYFKKKERVQEHIEHKEKVEILAQFENLSARECEKVLIKLDPESVKKDKVRVINEELTEIRLTVGLQFIRMLERLRQITSHSSPTATNAQLLEIAMAELLKRKDPLLKKDAFAADQPKQIEGDNLKSPTVLDLGKSGDIFNGKSVVCVSSSGERVSFMPGKGNSIPGKVNPAGSRADFDKLRNASPTSEVKKVEMRLPTNVESTHQKRPHRYIPTAMRVHIMKKFDGQCCYVDPKTGRRCDSRRFIQVDHIYPSSKGGVSRINNLQLLCANHNQWKGASTTPL